MQSAGIKPGATTDSPLIVYIAAGLFLGAAVPVSLLCHPLVLALTATLLAGFAYFVQHRLQLRRSACLVYAAVALLMGHSLSASHDRQPHAAMFIDADVRVEQVYLSQYGQAARCRVLHVYRPQGWQLQRSVFSYFPAVPLIASDDELHLRGLAEWSDQFHNWQLNLADFEIIKTQDAGARGHLWAALETLPRHQGLAAALLLGSASRQEKQQFRSAGIAHVLVVSGLHVGIVFMLCAWLLRSSGLPWWPAQVTLIGILIFYVVITGMAIPTQRAVLMAAIIIAANMLGRDLHKYAALSLTVILLVLWDPLSARGLSFQLSLAAVAGILSLGLSLRALRLRYLPLQAWPLDRPSWRGVLFLANGLLDGIAVGIAATLAVTPILAVHIGTCNPWSPLATVVVTPLVTMVIATGGIWLACTTLWTGGPWAGLQVLCDWSLDLLSRASQILSTLPGSELAVSAPPWPVLLLWPLLFIEVSSVWRLTGQACLLLILVTAWLCF